MSLTLGNFIDNMEKNGYPQIQFDMWGRDGNGTPNIKFGGCALGQACYNTFKDYEIPRGFWQPLYDIHSPSTGKSFDSYVVDLNDNQHLSIPEIVKDLRAEFADHLNTIIVYTYA